MFVQSKRTDEPPNNNRTSFIYLFKCHADPLDRVPNLQQPEGRPCGHEPWSQEADAGEVPQHEQV